MRIEPFFASWIPGALLRDRHPRLSQGAWGETLALGGWHPSGECGPAALPRVRPPSCGFYTGPGCNGSQELESTGWMLLGETRGSGPWRGAEVGSGATRRFGLPAWTKEGAVERAPCLTSGVWRPREVRLLCHRFPLKSVDPPDRCMGIRPPMSTFRGWVKTKQINL